MAGEVLTLAQATTNARLFARDVDATNDPGLTDAQYYELADLVYLDFMDEASEELYGLSSNDSGLELNGIGAQEKSTASLGTTPVPFIARWDKAFRETSSSAVAAGSEMHVVNPSVIHLLRKEDNSQGTPTHVSFEKIATPTGAAAGQWLARFWPPSDNLSVYYFSALVRPIAFIPSTVGSAYIFDLDPKESRLIPIMMAILAVPLLGDDAAYADRLLAMLPSSKQAALRARLESARAGSV